MHFVRTIREAERPHTGIHTGETEIGRHTATAMRLDRVVDDTKGYVRCRHLDHRDLGAGDLVADRIHHIGGLQREQARHFDVDTGTRNALFPDGVISDLLAESLAGEQALHHDFQFALCNADGAHAVMDAARPEAALADLEAATFAEKQVLSRNADIFEDHFGMAMRSVVIAEHRKHTDDLHARRIKRHEDL